MPPSLNQFDIQLLLRIAHQPCYGYELLREHPHRSSSSIYYSLHKLRQHKLAYSQSETNKKAPRLIRYRISRRGKLCLTMGLDSHIAVIHQRSAQLLQRYRQERSTLATLFWLRHQRRGDNQFRVP